MSVSEEASLLGLVSSFLGDDNDSKSEPPAAPYCNAVTEASESSSQDPNDEKQQHDTCIIVVIFSKDRPWQLQQLFRSMCLDKTCLDNDNMTVSLELLLHVTDQYQSAYDRVIVSVENILEGVPNVSLACHREDSSDASSFQSLLESIVTNEDNPTHWMFLTDDCLLLVPLRTLLQTATFAFTSNAHIKCFLSRLHPGVTWTQTRSLPSPPPRSFFRYLPGQSPQLDGVYVYPMERGELDWAYPWDLSGGIYTHSLVKNIYQKLQGTDGLSHPNRMEIAGNQELVPMINSSFLAAVPTRPMLLILAINRVQNVCQAPLACDDKDEMSPEALLSFYNEKKHLDLLRYRAVHFNSSHVGNLYLDSERGWRNDENNVDKPALSVLIPVHTGPPEAASHAIRSVMMQPIDEYNEHHRNALSQLLLSPMQIVVVDDRCADGSIDAMTNTIQRIATEYSFVKLTINDYRGGEISRIEPDNQDVAMNYRVELLVDIVSSPRDGVAVALNHGLTHCRSELVARMDADDVAGVGRLGAQIEALRYQSDLDVVGSSVLLFREMSKTVRSDELEQQKPNSACVPSDALPYSSSLSKEHNSTVNVVTSLPPTESGVAAWAMLFSCSIAHPAVVYRKQAIVDAGGYNEDSSSAEDYELWLRMTSQKCNSLASYPMIGLWHRKHRSRSERTSRQSDEALQASVEAMRDLLSVGSEYSAGIQLAPAASVLRKPDTATSLEQLNEAADLLVALEAAYLGLHDNALNSRQISLIRKDCEERFGELATLAVQRSLIDPSDLNSSVAWKVWCERCPELTMHRIALLCHSYRGS